MYGLGPAPENGRIARFQTQCRSIGGHVWPAFIDNGNDAQGLTNLCDAHAVWMNSLAHNVANGIGQGGDSQKTRCHGLDALVRQFEPIKHGGRTPLFTPGLEIPGVCGFEAVRRGANRMGGIDKRSVFHRRRQGTQILGGILGLPADSRYFIVQSHLGVSPSKTSQRTVVYL